MQYTVKQTGFTLIEILIALFIFVIIAMIVAVGLRTVLNVRTELEKKYAEMGDLQVAFEVLQRDIAQAVPRPITDADGESEPPLLGTPVKFAFTRGGIINPLAQEKRSTLQRITYELHNGELIRITAGALDALPNTPMAQRTILSNVSALQFAYLDEHNQPRMDWPLVANQTTLPRAVQLIITLKNHGRASRLFVIPNGIPLSNQ